MAKFLPKRLRPDAKPTVQLPKVLRRKTGGSGSKSLAQHLPKTQCTGTSKKRLRVYWIERMVSDGHQAIPAVDDPTLRYSDITELARNLGYDTDIRKLDPKIKEQCRCVKPAVAGCMVCRWHGGSNTRVLQAGRDALIELIMPGAERYKKVITKGKHDPSAIAAIKDVFDRVGLKKPEENKPSELVWSDELIAKMADVLTDNELETFIALHRKIQANTPEEDNELPEMLGTGTDGLKVVNVGPKKMAELIKSDKKK